MVVGRAAPGQQGSAGVVQPDYSLAVLDLVVKVQRIQEVLVRPDPQDLVAAAIQVFL